MKISVSSISQVILVLSLVAGYFLIDFKVIEKKLQGEGVYSLQDKDCDLRKEPCEVTIDDGTKFTLEVFPKDIPIMEKIKFKVKSSKDLDEDLSLKIYSTNMNMGSYELPLKNLSSGEYEVSSTLPACKIGGMEWNVEVQKTSLFSLTAARFNF